MKVEVFSNVDPARLQGQVNKFLKDNKEKTVTDIKFSTTYEDGAQELRFSAMIVYKA